jgi:hypothetical protein
MLKITLELAHKLVFDWQQHRDYAGAARRHGVDPRTVKAWVKVWKQHGRLDVKFSVRRKPALSSEAARVAADLLAAGKHGNAASVAAELHKRGLTNKAVHRTTLARHAKQAAKAQGRQLKVERGQPKKHLKEENVEARLSFAQANLGRDWGNVMITDRKRFYFKYPSQQVAHNRWAYADRPTTAFQPNKPSSVNLYAGLTKYGVTKPHIVSGTTGMDTKFKNLKGNTARNITSSEYKVVLLETLLPEGSRIFTSKGLTSWELQQDGDPSHKRASDPAVPFYNSQSAAKVQVLPDWPSNSPDLSPIENLWAIVEARVHAAGCKTFAEFKARVIKEWNGVSKKLCMQLMGSMDRRLKQCLQKGGKRIAY